MRAQLARRAAKKLGCPEDVFDVSAIRSIVSSTDQTEQDRGNLLAVLTQRTWSMERGAAGYDMPAGRPYRRCLVFATGCASAPKLKASGPRASRTWIFRCCESPSRCPPLTLVPGLCLLSGGPLPGSTGSEHGEFGRGQPASSPGNLSSKEDVIDGTLHKPVSLQTECRGSRSTANPSRHRRLAFDSPARPPPFTCFGGRRALGSRRFHPPFQRCVACAF